MSLDLADLADGAAQFNDPQRVLDAIVVGLCRAVPESQFFAGIYQSHPAVELGVSSACRVGDLLPLPGLHDAFARSATQFDRWAVQASQRNRWLAIETPSLGPSDLLNFWNTKGGTPSRFRRIVLCQGKKPLAYVSAHLASGRWNDASLRLLHARFRAVSAALRLTALAYRARHAPDDLSNALLDQSQGAFVFSDDGTLLACSPLARSWFTRDPEVRDWLACSSASARLRRMHLKRARLGRWQVVRCDPVQALPPTPIAETQPVDLTPRERELCEWLVAGTTNAEIAARIGVQPSTVKTMLERLYWKYEARGRVALTRMLLARACPPIGD